MNLRSLVNTRGNKTPHNLRSLRAAQQPKAMENGVNLNDTKRGRQNSVQVKKVRNGIKKTETPRSLGFQRRSFAPKDVSTPHHAKQSSCPSLCSPVHKNGRDADSNPLRLQMPDNLLSWIAYDWFQISNRKRKLVIPARVSVCDILDAYKCENPNIERMQMSKFIDTLYHNFMKIPKSYLYVSECIDYIEYNSDPRKKTNSPFGSFHLLRYLALLINEVNFEENFLGVGNEQLKEFLNGLLEYMSNNESELFRPIDFVEAVDDQD